MHSRYPLKQEWLLTYENPLNHLLGRDYFKKVPTCPGVYRFYGRYAGTPEALLYIGKAKNLRARLNSYRLAKPDSTSRKILWMLSQTCKIEFEICESEKTALLRENELLRTLRPPFNVMNTSPESYVAIGCERTAQGLRLRITDQIDEKGANESLYGVFKSRGAVRDAFGALLRLLWMSTRSQEEDQLRAEFGRYEIPGALLRYRPPSPYLLKPFLDPEFMRKIDRFLSGRSSALLRELTQNLLQKSAIPPFLYPRIQEDLELLSDFFNDYCRRNRKLCRHFGREGYFIEQEEIDDWLVAYAHD